MILRFDRRQFNPLLGTTLAGVASGFASHRLAAAEEKTITVLNWQGYGTDEAFALKAFAGLTGITVKHDDCNSEPEMLTTLPTNPGACDVVLVNSARDGQVIAEHLVDPIDLATVPNAAGLQDTPEHPDRRQDLWRALGVGHLRAYDPQRQGQRRGQLRDPQRSGLCGTGGAV